MRPQDRHHFVFNPSYSRAQIVIDFCKEERHQIRQIIDGDRVEMEQKW